MELLCCRISVSYSVVSESTCNNGGFMEGSRPEGYVDAIRNNGGVEAGGLSGYSVYLQYGLMEGYVNTVLKEGSFCYI